MEYKDVGSHKQDRNIIVISDILSEPFQNSKHNARPVNVNVFRSNVHALIYTIPYSPFIKVLLSS